MNTTFPKLTKYLLAIGILCATAALTAAPIDVTSQRVNSTLLAGDSFTINTSLTVPTKDAFGNLVTTTQIRDTAQSLALVGTLPEIREKDIFADSKQQIINTPFTWMGSNSFKLTAGGNGSDAAAFDGMVVRDAQDLTNDDSTVACIPVLRDPQFGAIWRIQADVLPGGLNGSNSVSVALFDDASKYGPTEQTLASGLGEMWAMLSTVQNGGETFGRLCLFINGDDMIARFENPIDEANLTLENVDRGFPAAVYADFGDYTAIDFNKLFMEWHADDNSVSLKVNDTEVLRRMALDGFDFDPTINGNQSPDFFGVGFQMLGDGSLDNFQATPEPSSMVMMCFGMLFFGWNNRRNRRRARKIGGLGFSMNG